MKLVVKLGGAVAEGAAATVLALAEEHDVCVVHGAGPQISDEMERCGLPVRFVGGRRVTTAAALAVVRRSLCAVNRSLCAALGPRAVGLIGDEIGLRAFRVPELGLVGDAVPSRPALVDDALDAELLPVVAPLAVGPLNVNADEAAAALAVGLHADRMLGDGTFEGGIVPKLRAAVAAARLGVPAEIGTTAVTV